MKKHVQNRAKRAQFAAEAERSDHNSRVIDARIGEQTPKIPLHKDERGGEQNRKNAKHDQHLTWEFWAEAFLSEHVEAHDRIDGAIDKGSAQQSGSWHGRFGVSVGLPGMHGGQS